MKKLQRTARQLAYQALDPRTLGRPVHLLPRFTQLLEEHLSEMLRATVNRRYHSNFQVTGMSMFPLQSTWSSGAEWTAYSGPSGIIAIAIERPLVLRILSYRYGIADEAVSSESMPRLPAKTATEERLEGVLGCQFAETVAACIRSVAASSREEEELPSEFKPVAGPLAPAHGAWVVKAELQDAQQVEGSLQILLDESWISRLLEGLAPLREKTVEPSVHVAPLEKRLQLRIVARLLEKEISLGELEDLKIGSVIPVSLGATDVLIDDSRLFTATVAEHNGKLCLTSFQDTD